MKWTTSWARVASNDRSWNGRSSAGRLPCRDAGIAFFDGSHEGRHRVDGDDVRRADRCDELGRERTRPAPDVEHALAGLDAREVRHLRRQQDRVATHEPVVRLGGDIEAHRPN